MYRSPVIFIFRAWVGVTCSIKMYNQLLNAFFLSILFTPACTRKLACMNTLIYMHNICEHTWNLSHLSNLWLYVSMYVNMSVSMYANIYVCMHACVKNYKYFISMEIFVHVYMNDYKHTCKHELGELTIHAY